MNDQFSKVNELICTIFLEPLSASPVTEKLSVVMSNFRNWQTAKNEKPGNNFLFFCVCTLFRLIGQKNFENAKRMGTITNDKV